MKFSSGMRSVRITVQIRVGRVAELSHESFERVRIAGIVSEDGVLEEHELFSHDLDSILVEEAHFNHDVAAQLLVLVAELVHLTLECSDLLLTVRLDVVRRG